MAEFKSLADIERNRPGHWQPTFTVGMLSQMRNVGGAVWSPDGRYLYYPQDFNGRTDVMRADATTGQAVQITTDVEAGGLLRIAQSALDVSPDGSKVLYMSGKDGKIWLIPAGGGIAKRLTKVGEGMQHAASFSPDGRQVVYVAVFGEYQEIAVVGSDGEEWPRRVSRGDHFVADPQWLPDGKRLVYLEHDNQHLPWVETRIVLADLESGEQKILADGWGANIHYHTPRPSPDGRWLAFVSNESGWANVYLLNLETGQKYPLSPAEREQGEPTWTPDSRSLAYTFNRTCNIGICFSTLEGQNITVSEGEHVCTALGFSPDGQHLVYLKQSVDFPPNLFVYRFKDSVHHQVTLNSIGGLDEAGLVEAETINWKSPDGLDIEGLLYAPARIQPGKHPMLLHVHGGPISQYNRRWDPAVQYWVSRGWVVVEPNFRGSTGYGRDFRDKLNGAWGQEDMLDNIGGIEYAKSRDLIDPNRVVAWGGSGGGYATMLLVGKWPDLFHAGVALVGVSNFMTFQDETDRIAKYLIQDILGPRPDNFALFAERSPVSYAKDIKAPLLIMMGADDKRVPALQGEEMVEALKKAGKTDFEYVSYPGEGHGWRKVDTLVDFFQRMDKFLTRWVLER